MKSRLNRKCHTLNTHKKGGIYLASNGKEGKGRKIFKEEKYIVHGGEEKMKRKRRNHLEKEN